MTLSIRAATRDELAAFLSATAAGFLHDQPDPIERFDATMELSRTRCALDQAEIVGTLAAFSFDFAVPGASVPAAGTTAITVRPTHRRQGLLRRMMESHLEEVSGRQEPLAVLWASESGIYSRFGYGCAADTVSTVVENVRGVFDGDAVATGRVRQIDDEEAKKLLPSLYESQWRERPGWFARPPGWWEHRRLSDPPERRQGGTAWRYAIAEGESEPTGYMQYRTKERWDDRGLPCGEVWVTELVGRDPAARASLWRLALDTDLATKLVAWNEPADSVLPWLLAEPRRAMRHLRDSLWVRVMNVPDALAARRYSTADRLVLGVRDRFRPENQGRYVVEGGPDGASCQRTDAASDLDLDVSDLGALYLGGRSAAALARAGRITGDAAALRRANAFFGWHVAPSCPELF